MKNTILFALMVTLSACATTQQEKPQQTGMFGIPLPPPAPGVFDVFCMSGPAVQDQCGLISTNEKAQFKDFSKKHCSNISGSDCRKNFAKMMFAKFELRYYGANWSEVTRELDANGGSGSMVETEKAFISSHNREMYARYQEDQDKKQAARDEAFNNQMRLMQSQRPISSGPTFHTIKAYEMKTNPTYNINSRNNGNTTYTTGSDSNGNTVNCQTIHNGNQNYTTCN